MPVAQRSPAPSFPALREAYDLGRRAHGPLPLAYEQFAAGHAGSRPPAHAADFYLARACDAGVDGAWERLQQAMDDPLRGFLHKRGASRSDADQLLGEAWGALASPPPRGAAATRIGTYDGRGSLRSWLATILWRRLADRWRTRHREEPLEVAERMPQHADDDPAEGAAHAESARRLGLALEDAWTHLTDRELHALVLKYRHQVPQKDIARILGVGAPRVSRILRSATNRLREALGGLRDTPGTSGGWNGLMRTIETMLARSAAEREAPGGRRNDDA